MDNGAPWWTPRSVWNHSPTSPAIKAAHWKHWYDSLMSRHILPLMPDLCNLYNRPGTQTASNAFLISKKATYTDWPFSAFAWITSCSTIEICRLEHLFCPAPWSSSITCERLNHSFFRLSIILSSDLRNTEIRVIHRLQSLIVWPFPGLGIVLIKPFLNCPGMSFVLTIAFKIHLRVSMHTSLAYFMCSTVVLSHPGAFLFFIPFSSFFISTVVIGPPSKALVCGIFLCIFSISFSTIFLNSLSYFSDIPDW